MKGIPDLADLAAVESALLPEVLLASPALWDSVIFQQEVPDFHSHLWHFLIDDEIKQLVIELPAGHAKTQLISVKYTIYRLCKDPNDRICLMQKSLNQAKDVITAIQRELVGNDTLINLYGPFKPESSAEGYPWSKTTFRIIGNTNRGMKTNSVHAFGESSTDIMGNRFKLFNGDDYVTEENSDTAEKRARVDTKENTEWIPTLVGAENPRVILSGTPMYYNDGFESKFNRASDYLGPEDWRLPHEVDKSGWVFIRRSAEKPPPKRAGQTLFPVQVDWAHLEERKKAGYVNYLRRYTCQVSDATTQIFKEKAIRGGTEEETGNTYPGCLDYQRPIGQHPPGLKIICGVDPASGKKTSASAQFAHVTIGYDKTEDTIYIVDFFTGPVSATHAADKTAPRDKESQVGTIIHRHHKYGAQFTIIEDNSQQHAWLDMVRANDRSVKVKGHNTGRNKTHAETGVDGMAGYFESGHIRFPYGGAETQKIMDELILQLIRYPHGDYTDGVMALWFAWYNVRKHSKVEFFDYYKFRAQAEPLFGRKTA